MGTRRNIMINARFVHTNLIAQDWNKLAQFYQQVFGCIPVPPSRDIAGKWIEDATGVPNAKIRGIHLRLPGHGDNGPTLEIFEYNNQESPVKPAANRPGFQHIAFSVDDVEAAQDAVIAAGGGMLGKIASSGIPGAGMVTLVYLTDTEGNIIELQRWS
jgi:predicted enzyme related to lactoylglutathione lyase